MLTNKSGDADKKGEDSLEIPSIKYFTKEFALKKAEETSQLSQQQLQRGKKLKKKGSQEYKKENHTKAVKYFESALDIYATGQLYYRYGNSAWDHYNLKAAVKAYELALELGYPHKKYAYYNMACAYSEMGESKPGEPPPKETLWKSLKFLEKAVEEGYDNAEHIRKDSDLANLENAFPSEFGAVLLKAQDFSFAGKKIIESGGMQQINKYFCSNGWVKFEDLGVPHREGKTITYAKWKPIKNGVKVIPADKDSKLEEHKITYGSLNPPPATGAIVRIEQHSTRCRP